MDASRKKYEVENIIFSSLEDLVDVDVETIDRSKSFLEYGMDSIDCLDFSHQVEDKLDLSRKLDHSDVGDVLSVDSVLNAIDKKIKLI
jgi:acyl carrier protein